MAQPVPVAPYSGEEPALDLGDAKLSVLLAAKVQSGATQIPVMVRSLSSIAAQISSRVIPPLGSLVRFSRGDVAVSARVVSTSTTGFELEFREAIDERALLIDVAAAQAKAAESRRKALFPMEQYVGQAVDEENGLPRSKH